MTGGETVYIVLGWFGDQEWIEGEWETGGPDRVWIQRAYRTREEATDRSEALWETRTTESPEAPDYVQQLAKFAVAELVLR